MNFFLIQALNGLSFGMLLFLLAAGLSLIYGSMRILNLTHGSFYLLSAYVGLTISQATGSFLLALVASIAVIAVLGFFMERFLLRRLAHKELAQTLLTFGCLFIIADLSLSIWGGNPQTIDKPALLSQSIRIGGLVYPSYRVFLIVFGLLIAGILWFVMDNTRVGAMVRASVDDEETARALGINVSWLFSAVFVFGASLAAIGGVMGGPIVGVYPGADYEVMLLSFVVVIIGGLGSLRGAFVGSLAVGILDNFGKVFFPELALFTIFAPMALILALRPVGLFGQERS